MIIVSMFLMQDRLLGFLLMPRTCQPQVTPRVLPHLALPPFLGSHHPQAPPLILLVLHRLGIHLVLVYTLVGVHPLVLPLIHLVARRLAILQVLGATLLDHRSWDRPLIQVVRRTHLNRLPVQPHTHPNLGHLCLSLDRTT